MRLIYRNRGSVSVILLIILLPMIVFAGLMIDISNRSLAKTAAEGAGELALNSALADFDTVLKDTYGLFAMSQMEADRQEALNGKTLEDFEAALESSGLLDLSFENFRAEAIEESSLANPEILEKSIVEFMKYRGPAEAGLSLLDSLASFGKLDGQAAVADKKMAVEGNLKEFSAACGEFYQILLNFNQTESEYLKAEKKLDKSIEALKSIADKDSDEYTEALDAAEANYADMRAASPIETVKYSISVGNRIKTAIADLSKANEDFGNKVEEYRNSDAGSEDSFYVTMKEENEKYASQFDPDDVDEVIAQLEAAERYLSMREFETLQEYIEAPKTESDAVYLKGINELYQRSGICIEVPRFYVYLSAMYGNAGAAAKSEFGDGKILRKNVSELNSQVKADASADEAFSYAMQLFDNSPSGNKSMDSEVFSDIANGDSMGAAKQFGNMSGVVSDMLSVLKEGVENIRNNLLITEYAINNLSYLTSDAEQKTMTGVPIDPDHNRIYGCEAEYIIFGSKGSEEEKFLWFTTREAAGPEANIAAAKTNIFAVRFVFNSVFALTDPSIDQMTLAPALSIQAATGGVFPYQIAQLTLKLALAMGESAIDLKDLTGGEKVPLMKTSATWRCSVGGMINALKDKVTGEITGLARKGINDSIGFIQNCIDGAVSAADIGVDAVIEGISADLETALTGSLQEAVGSMTAVIRTQAEKAVVSFFSEGKFNEYEFIGNVRSELESLVNGFGEDIKDYIEEELLPQIEGTLLKDIAQSISKDINGVSEEDYIALEDALFSNVMNEISGHIKSFLDQISSGITGKVREITSAAGRDLRELARSKGGELAEDIEKQLAEKTSEVLERYLPRGRFDAGIPSGGSNKGSGISEKILMFSYKDYLRLFLLLKLSGSQKKDVLLRIADVIQLNVAITHKRGNEFRMANAYTYAEITADIKVRSLLFSNRIDLLGGDNRYYAVSGY